MGNEIVYCRKCQTRLLSSDFERGAAFKIDGVASCDMCSADVLNLLAFLDLVQELLDPVGRRGPKPSK